jgi:hypothetical protein
MLNCYTLWSEWKQIPNPPSLESQSIWGNYEGPKILVFHGLTKLRVFSLMYNHMYPIVVYLQGVLKLIEELYTYVKANCKI